MAYARTPFEVEEGAVNDGMKGGPEDDGYAGWQLGLDMELASLRG